MHAHRTLNQLRPGQGARIFEVAPQGDCDKTKRLWDMGFTEGAQVKCLFKAPSGEPVAYLIRGTVVALRREEAQMISLLDDARVETVERMACMRAEAKPGDLVISLAGNPNVGKSTVFNFLTGMRQHTGNWPGKTVAGAWGRFVKDKQGFVFVDTPGTYSLEAQSAEEVVARDCICFGGADATAIVCDATCLERNLNLVLQVLECTPRAVVIVNLMDEAEKQKIQVDLHKLESALGAPVIGSTARSGQGLDALAQKIIEVCTKKVEIPPLDYGEKIEEAVLSIMRALSGRKLAVSERFAALRLLEGGGFADEIARQSGFSADEIPEIMHFRAQIPDARAQIVARIYRRAEEIVSDCVRAPNMRKSRQEKWDRILTGRLTGVPIMLILLAVVFFLTIKGANYPSQMLFHAFNWIEGQFTVLFRTIYAPLWLEKMLVEGVFRVLGWVVSVMLPPMAIFFPMFTILEDLGVLPRVAFNLDSRFKRCKACGKQCLTMMMGLGCNAVGVIGCRIIDSPRERLIAILTNVFMPCNGRFPMILSISAVFFGYGMASGAAVSALVLTGVIILGVAVTFLVSRALSETVLKGMPSSFTLELPPFRRPQVLQVLIRSLLDRTLFVLARAVKVAIPAGFLIWLMANITVSGSSVLQICVRTLDPFGRILGMDGAILMAFILGFPANEIVLPLAIMAYSAGSALVETQSIMSLRQILLENGWTYLTALNVILFSLMHWPCSTTLLTIRKETGSGKWTLAALLIPTVCGAGICALTAFFARLIHLG